MLLNLAQSLTAPFDIVLVGNYLGLEQFTIDACLADNDRDTRMAAHAMLASWRQRQGNKAEAYKNLRTALEKANRIKDIVTILEADE